MKRKATKDRGTTKKRILSAQSSCLKDCSALSWVFFHPTDFMKNSINVRMLNLKTMIWTMKTSHAAPLRI